MTPPGRCTDTYMFHAPDDREHMTRCGLRGGHSGAHTGPGWGDADISWQPRAAPSIMGMHHHEYTGFPPTCGCGKSKPLTVARAPAAECSCSFTVLGGDMYPDKTKCIAFLAEHGVIPCDPLK